LRDNARYLYLFKLKSGWQFIIFIMVENVISGEKWCRSVVVFYSEENEQYTRKFRGIRNLIFRTKWLRTYYFNKKIIFLRTLILRCNDFSAAIIIYLIYYTQYNTYVGTMYIIFALNLQSFKHHIVSVLTLRQRVVLFNRYYYY